LEDAKRRDQRVYGQLVSPDYFSVPAWTRREGESSAPIWTRPAPSRPWSSATATGPAASNPDAIGQTIHLNGQPATIVGITPRKFDGALTVNPAELFVPTTVSARLAPELGNDVLHNRNAKVINTG
jgi:hypothetical protein